MRLLRLGGLLSAALLVGVGVLWWSTGVDPITWARSSDVRGAYGAQTPRILQAQAFTAMGLVGPALGAIEALPPDPIVQEDQPPDATPREDLLAALFPKALQSRDP